MKLNALRTIGCFLLFYLICTGVVYTLSAIMNIWYIDIMNIWWNLSVVSVILMLAFVFVCKKTTSKDKSAYCHYYKFNCKLLRQVKTNAWCWVYSSFLKILQIFNRFEVSPQVRKSNDTTDNHSFHILSKIIKKGSKTND